MKVFKCDGHRFSDGVKCQNETDSTDEKGFPSNWLTFDGSIVNNKKEAHTIIANGEKHFCSWECLYLFLFKNTCKL